MRTEQFEEGWNSLRMSIQDMLNDYNEKEHEIVIRLIKLVSHPYYERDGQDWKHGDEPVSPYDRW